MWWLLIPLLIVLAILFSVSTLAASLIGAMGGNWPWLLIALGVFLFWKEDGRHRRARREWRQHGHHGWTPRTVPKSEPQPAPAKVVASKASAEADSKAKRTKEPTPLPRKPELPIDVQVKVEQIKRKVDVMLGYADRFPPFSKDLYIVRTTASEYLPRTINAYLALPPETAEKPLRADGQTPHQELMTQLNLLDSKLDEIAQDMQREDVDRLLANRQFLEDRFGRASA
jgi:hypothetical protein